ncbi:UNVERIFIED_CONTAM: hypothetical protein HDU68_005355 [Siphonaria sp. JEL0065]|nr:hypothetical protein HDU68_005355 [Siphonaria sp. JEL0065]
MTQIQNQNQIQSEIESETLKRKAQTEIESLKPELETEKRQKIDDDSTAPAAEAETGNATEAKETDDAESIYPDSEEFYAWLVTGSEAGNFLACHRLKSVEPALPATEKLIEYNVKEVYDPADDAEEETEAAATQGEETKEASKDEASSSDETKELSEDEKKKQDEIEELKDTVNFAIEDSYCIVLQDFTATESVTEEPSAAQALRQTLVAAADSKTWIKLRVSREELTAAEDARVPVTVSVFDARKGLIIPKIGCWKWLVEVEAAESAVDAGLKKMMERYC